MIPKNAETHRCPCVKGFGHFDSGRSDERCRAPKPCASPSELHLELRNYYNGYGEKLQGEKIRREEFAPFIIKCERSYYF